MRNFVAALFLGGLVMAAFGINSDVFDDTEKPTQEELAHATSQCYGQRIGDPLFPFPYKMSCAEWVKDKCGDNKYTQQWIADHIKTEKLAEEEWGN